jgi:hypothetical protein
MLYKYDMRFEFKDRVSFSMLHRMFGNTNYFTFPVNAYSHGRNRILEDEYFTILRSKKKQKWETAE